MAEILEIHPETPQERHIRKAAKIIQKGGVIIYPTDTIYALGCDLFNRKAIERLCLIKGLKPEKLNLSFICSSISDVSQYSSQLNTSVYRLLKENLPGPFTFILNASSQVPKIVGAKKKQVGIRVPNNPIALALVNEIGHPIISTSLKNEDELVEYLTDPEEIIEQYQKRVDLIIDGGAGKNQPSTVIDCTGSEPEIIREGLGELAV